MSQSFRYRTLWLSDIHLGSRACRIDLLLDFLRRHRCERLYLVGDIIDPQRMRKRFYWPKSHTEALELILAMARSGTRVVYVPGNHDHDFRGMAGSHLGPVEVHRETVHETADGRRLLVLHGDEFDSTLRCNALASLIGCAGYGLLLGLNRLTHGRQRAPASAVLVARPGRQDANRQGSALRCEIPGGMPRRGP